MKILIACEFSGIVRDAFIAAGHDAISCDLLPPERLLLPELEDLLPPDDLELEDLLGADLFTSPDEPDLPEDDFFSRALELERDEDDFFSTDFPASLILTDDLSILLDCEDDRFPLD